MPFSCLTPFKGFSLCIRGKRPRELNTKSSSSSFPHSQANCSDPLGSSKPSACGLTLLPPAASFSFKPPVSISPAQTRSRVVSFSLGGLLVRHTTSCELLEPTLEAGEAAPNVRHSSLMRLRVPPVWFPAYSLGRPRSTEPGRCPEHCRL